MAMLHPFFSTLVKRPDLVIDHLSAYAALFHQEAASAGTELLQRMVAWVLALLSGVVFLGLAGIALMMGMMQHEFHWILVVVPGVVLIMMVISVMWALKPLKSERFPELRAQIDSDAQALRAVA